MARQRPQLYPRKGIDASTIPTAFAVATGLLDWKVAGKDKAYLAIGQRIIEELAQHDVKLLRKGDADWELTLYGLFIDDRPRTRRKVYNHRKYRGRLTELTRRAVEHLLPPEVTNER